ncbi:unnamed protein product [Mortierella alpina]
MKAKALLALALVGSLVLFKILLIYLHLRERKKKHKLASNIDLEKQAPSIAQPRQEEITSIRRPDRTRMGRSWAAPQLKSRPLPPLPIDTTAEKLEQGTVPPTIPIPNPVHSTARKRSYTL